MFHRVRLDKDSPEAMAALEVPGVAWRFGGLVVPDNAIEVVRPLGVRIHPPTIQPAAKAALAWLRPGVVEKILPFQREGVGFALSCPNESAMLVHPTGAGKTLSSIVWALARPGVTVVVTKAAVVGQWASEVQEWSTAAPVVLEGRAVSLDALPFARGIADPLVPQFVILSYAIVAAWAPHLGALRPMSVIFDESPKAKAHKRWDAITDPDADDPTAVKFKLKENVTASCMQIARAASRRLATTATPIQDRVRDLWAQLDLVQPRAWGPFWPWAKRYAGATEGMFGGMEAKGSTNIPELKLRLKRVAHYVPKSIVDAQLPGARRRVLYLRPEDQSRPEAAAKDIRAAAKRGPVALLEMRLMEAASRKRRFIVDRVEEALKSNEKVVVFTGRRVDAERLGEAVAKLGIGKSWCAHGGHDPLAREAIRKEYMETPGPCCLVGTGDSWGEGLNLQDTDLAIFAMLPYTPGQIIQWEGRFSRLGQKRPVLIQYVVAQGTVDEHVAGILLQKLPAVESLGGSQQAGAIMRDLIGDEEELIGSLVKMIGAGNAN